MSKRDKKRKEFYRVATIWSMICSIFLILALFFEIIFLIVVEIAANSLAGPDGTIYILIPLLFPTIAFVVASIIITIKIKKACENVGKSEEKDQLVLGILTIIFSGIIPGILVLIGTSTFNVE